MVEGVKELVEQEINAIKEIGLNRENLESLFKLVDIHKDICEEAMLEKEENMNYGRRRRNSRTGRYMEGGNYGKRYNEGEEMIDRMSEGYQEYHEGIGEYHRSGDYGAKDEGMESLEYMLDSMVKFYEHIMKEAETAEETELVRKYVRKLKDM